jgi:hypothetical protein
MPNSSTILGWCFRGTVCPPNNTTGDNGYEWNTSSTIGICMFFGVIAIGAIALAIVDCRRARALRAQEAHDEPGIQNEQEMLNQHQPQSYSSTV